MLFRRDKGDAEARADDAAADQRQAALGRLARFAAEDAARIAERDADRVDARRRARAEPGSPQLTESELGEWPHGAAALDEEIADALERLGSARPERDEPGNERTDRL